MRLLQFTLACVCYACPAFPVAAQVSGSDTGAQIARAASHPDDDKAVRDVKDVLGNWVRSIPNAFACDGRNGGPYFLEAAEAVVEASLREKARQAKMQHFRAASSAFYQTCPRHEQRGKQFF